jgi:thiol-disulfide isomerase/thioredoxin
MSLFRPVRVLLSFVALALIAAACSSSDPEARDPGAESPSTTVAGLSTADLENDGDAAIGPTEAAAEWNGTFTYEPGPVVPDFPLNVDWLNVERPLSIAQDLRGKIVLLDFWTQGCINCIHVIPDLKRLEAEFADELVVIGVHWAKFDRERQLEAVRQSVLRYGVEHPVVNDALEQIRQTFGVNAWPTFVLIDPESRIIGQHSGEGAYDVFGPVVATMAAEYTAAGLIDPTPLEMVLEKTSAAPTVLSFPGKVLADEHGGRLFVADTGHHRILVSDLDGELITAIGSGAEGAEDGDFESAMFSRPQGMALSEDGRTLYIADRENHLIRAADLVAGTVTTIAGIGFPVTRFEPGPAITTAIASPWDLHLDGDQLFIAGAGRHQLWVLELESEYLDLFAGTGGEGLDDGHRLSSTLSQPSGFASDGDRLWFTDPEASAVRVVDLATDELTTLVGDGLFAWGDVDGSFDSALLQHAIGIELVDGDLIIADTYNHTIKVVDLDARTVESLTGTGEPGIADGRLDEALFAEPSGLSLAGDVLYVADTNNHQIRQIDLSAGRVSTLAFSNLDVATLSQSTLQADLVSVAPQAVAIGDVELVVHYTVPEGYKFNDQGTFTMSVSSDDSSVATVSGEDTYSAMGPEMPVRFTIAIAEGSTTIRTISTVFYCLAEDEAFCLIRDVDIEIPIVVSASGASQILVEHDLPSADLLDSQL